ncbi:hypothetical protein Q5W88_01230 [Shouchella clausii]|uniref:hypothetical protein n=1 Tax=Shouchella clausii TaxID=79880 RepID=UPI0026F466F2|nr:hypothetical protein [Shouchella clausii]MDO7281755.1 hypothetical protein [Shouchella clausii]MDO7301850.1 hypothetical protein [Shouchella clausii]
MKKVSIILFASLFMLSACGEDYYREASGSDEKTIVTLEMFEQIEDGLSSKEVYDIVQGYPNDIVEVNDRDVFMYEGDDGATIEISFSNDTVVKTHEYGLTESKQNTTASTASTNKSDSTSKENTDNTSDEGKISNEAIDYAIEIISDYEEVQDSAVTHNDEEIVLALVVSPSTNQETQQQLLDNFARALGSGVSIFGDYEMPTADDLGSIYDEYNLQVVSGTSAEDVQVHGAKNKNAKSISF